MFPQRVDLPNCRGHPQPMRPPRPAQRPSPCACLRLLGVTICPRCRDLRLMSHESHFILASRVVHVCSDHSPAKSVSRSARRSHSRKVARHLQQSLRPVAMGLSADEPGSGVAWFASAGPSMCNSQAANASSLPHALLLPLLLAPGGEPGSLGTNKARREKKKTSYSALE